MFLREVFIKGSIDSLDKETFLPSRSFFENNLNVSEIPQAVCSPQHPGLPAGKNQKNHRVGPA
jgi:hypothetical protein